MKALRVQVHQLIDQLTEEEIASFWSVLLNFYCDRYMLQAIQNSKASHNPGDTLTRDEAIRLLPDL